MNQILTLRIDADTQRTIAQLANKKKTTRSQIVREALQLLSQQMEPGAGASAYQVASDLIGSYQGGRNNRSENTGKQFRSQLRKKSRL
jgi:hypothetical protein